MKLPRQIKLPTSLSEYNCDQLCVGFQWAVFDLQEVIRRNPTYALQNAEWITKMIADASKAATQLQTLIKQRITSNENRDITVEHGHSA